MDNMLVIAEMMITDTTIVQIIMITITLRTHVVLNQINKAMKYVRLNYLKIYQVNQMVKMCYSML